MLAREARRRGRRRASSSAAPALGLVQRERVLGAAEPAFVDRRAPASTSARGMSLPISCPSAGGAPSWLRNPR
jgi:hypothetical protein